MVDRIEYFAVTFPAGTPISAPITAVTGFQQGNVLEIDIKVPAGPSGLMGFFIAAGGSQYVPRTAGSFVVADDDDIVWPMQNAINSGDWKVTGYNTDIYPHTIYVTFKVNELTYTGGSGVRGIGDSSALIPSSAI